MEYIVEMDHINKTFPGVKALDDVHFNLKSGEVMALLGENGAGKSTLVKVLSGVVSRDSGEIKVFGESVGDLTPKKAQELGIAIIHQELNLCRHLTVTQNMFLGREKAKNGVLTERAMKKQAAEVLDRLKVGITPDMVVGDMPMSMQQMVEIAKALSINAKVLIMDEPTSALTSREIDDLFAIIHRLKADSVGIIYISHRLDELQHIADRVTIMRDGRFITSKNFQDISIGEIISNMVGKEIKEKYPRIEMERGSKVFEVRGLNRGALVRDVNFELYQGEIVGISGLMGAGRTETTRAIFGIDRKESGEIYLDGKKVTINRPIDAINNGIVLAPEDRKKDGLCTKLSIKDNIALPNLDYICNKAGVVNRRKEKEIINKSIEDLRIKTRDADSNAESLSGGNQQKVVVAKWLVRDSRVVMFDEPTRGIDVAAKVEIYNLMNELKRQGVAVMFVSSEMDEIMGFSDRILVMCDGRITGEFMHDDATPEKIMVCATDFEKKEISQNIAL